MKLQLALDFGTLNDAITLTHKLEDYIDIIEIGTPLLKREGMRAIERMKQEFPDHEILADLKLMDAGEYEAGLAFTHGADIVTVLGVANDSTIAAAQHEASRHGRQVMVDMMNVHDVDGKVEQLKQIGVAYICVHRAVDSENGHKDPMYQVKNVRAVRRIWQGARLAVAGGIDSSNLGLIVAEQPQVVIVGRTISGADNPRAAAQSIKERLKIKMAAYPYGQMQAAD